jgi:hypothetical protein
VAGLTIGNKKLHRRFLSLSVKALQSGARLQAKDTHQMMALFGCKRELSGS